MACRSTFPTFIINGTHPGFFIPGTNATGKSAIKKQVALLRCRLLSFTVIAQADSRPSQFADRAFAEQPIMLTNRILDTLHAQGLAGYVAIAQLKNRHAVQKPSLSLLPH